MELQVSVNQLHEILHKLNIVADEPDLLDSYELEEPVVTDWMEHLYIQHPRPTGPVMIDIPEELLDCVIGEIENSYDIAKDNVADGHDEWRGQLTSLGQFLTKLRALQQEA